jgi:hypothetical protein
VREQRHSHRLSRLGGWRGQLHRLVQHRQQRRPTQRLAEQQRRLDGIAGEDDAPATVAQRLPTGAAFRIIDIDQMQVDPPLVAVGMQLAT